MSHRNKVLSYSRFAMFVCQSICRFAFDTPATTKTIYTWFESCLFVNPYIHITWTELLCIKPCFEVYHDVDMVSWLSHMPLLTQYKQWTLYSACKYPLFRWYMAHVVDRITLKSAFGIIWETHIPSYCSWSSTFKINIVQQYGYT